MGDPEICSVGSRVMVEDTVVDRMVAKIQERITLLHMGDCLDMVR